jgi:hypothetical protein
VPDLTTLKVIAVIFLATLIRSTFGFGEGLVSVPLLALFISIQIAAPLAVLVSVLVAGVVVIQDWRKIEVRSAAGLVMAALFGIPIGLYVLEHGNERYVKMALGLVIVLFSLYSLFAKAKLHLQKDHPTLLVVCGVVSGVLGGAYGLNGPPLVVYGSLRRWSPQHFRATLQGYFLPASIAGTIGYLWTGRLNHEVARYFVYSLPGVVVAIVIGRMVNHRLRGDAFIKIVFGGLVLIGAVLIAEGIPHR